MSLLLSPLQPKKGESVTKLNGDLNKLIECLYDSMTECVYQHPITSFIVETKPQPVFEVDILGKGRAALETANDDLGETPFTVSKLEEFVFALFSLSLFPSLLLLLSLRLVLNVHLPFSFFMPLFSLAAIYDYTACAGGGNNATWCMTLLLSWLKSQDSDDAAHYLARACVSNVLWNPKKR